MKKLSLVLGMVMAASFAMAQNTSDTKQIGNGNQISVDQTGSANLVGRVSTDNPTVTYSSQTGDDNKANVTQSGTGNTAFFEQGTSYRFPGTLPVNGNNNEITINQSGKKNKTWGYSLGNANIVSVTQAGDGTVDAINSAGHWLWGNGNHATQSQTGGIGNSSYIAANSSGNSSTIMQVGKDNDATTSQGWIGYANHDGNTATINQTGIHNVVSLPSTFVFAGYTEDLYGYGIQQYGMSNEGSVTQTGDDNKSAIWQFGNYNEGTINQLSSLNTAYLIQLGSNNSSTITQEFGNFNVVNLKQDGVGGEATVLQHGDGNVVKGLGIDVMATSLDGSTLDVEQWGTTNTLNLQQTNGASATVYQNGTSNIATVIQN